MSYGTASEIVLIDVNKKRTEGEAMDLNHGVPLVRPVRVWAGDYQDYEDADIIVITARLAQKSGRQELAEPDETVKASSSEEIEIGAVKKEEKRKKARLRRRGTYRKAHTD